MRAGGTGRATDAGDAVVRRKGERPLPVYLDTWSITHSAAQSVARGTWHLDASVGQTATTYKKRSRSASISPLRLAVISANGWMSLADMTGLG